VCNAVRCSYLGQQHLPDLLKLVRRLHAKKRVSMLLVSARLGISVSVDKPAILARTSAKPAPTRYAFPASATQNSGTPVFSLQKVLTKRYDLYITFKTKVFPKPHGLMGLIPFRE